MDQMENDIYPSFFIEEAAVIDYDDLSHRLGYTLNNLPSLMTEEYCGYSEYYFVL